MSIDRPAKHSSERKHTPMRILLAAAAALSVNAALAQPLFSPAPSLINPAPPPPSQSPQLFAPNGTYLGNLNANRYDPNSVANPYGPYGSPYSPNSINNPYGQYGSPYSPNSVRNPYGN